MNTVVGFLVGVYVVVGAVTYIVVVNWPGASGRKKLVAAFAALVWPVTVIVGLVDEWRDE